MDGTASEAEKAALVRSLFGARSDGYATRWGNTTTGKSGWSHAVRAAPGPHQSGAVADQWSFLSSTARMAPGTVASLAASLRPVDAGPTLSLADLAKADGPAPPAMIRSPLGAILCVPRAGRPSRQPPQRQDQPHPSSHRGHRRLRRTRQMAYRSRGPHRGIEAPARLGPGTPPRTRQRPAPGAAGAHTRPRLQPPTRPTATSSAVTRRRFVPTTPIRGQLSG